MPRRSKPTSHSQKVRSLTPRRHRSNKSNLIKPNGNGWTSHGDGLYSRTRGLPKGMEEHFDAETKHTGFYLIRNGKTRLSLVPHKTNSNDRDIFAPHENVLAISFEKGVSPLGKSKEVYRQEGVEEAREMIVDFRWMSNPKIVQWFKQKGFAGISSLTRNTGEISFLKRHFPVVILPARVDARIMLRRMLDQERAKQGWTFSKHVKNPFWNVYIRFEWLDPASETGKRLLASNALSRTKTRE